MGIDRARGARVGDHEADRGFSESFDAFDAFGAPRRDLRQEPGNDLWQDSRRDPRPDSRPDSQPDPRRRDRSPVRPAGGRDSLGATPRRTGAGRSSVPVLGPLVRLVAIHPFLAAAVALIAIAGGGVAAVAASSGSADSSDPANTPHSVHGFKMALPLGDAPPVGYDFSQTPPAVTDLNGEALYVKGNQLVSTSGQLAAWDGGTPPTAAQCREILARSAVPQLDVWPGRLVCYVDKNNNPGYIRDIGSTGAAVTVDATQLR